MIEVAARRAWQAGDRVRFLRTGETGEVVVSQSTTHGMVGIRFDDYAAHRHDLDGAVSGGYGWWAFPREIERE